MKTSTFIASLSAVGITAVGLVTWALQDSGKTENGKPNTEHTRKAAKRPAHSTLHTDHSRFVGLTDTNVRWQVRVDQLRRLDASTLNAAEIDYLFSLLRQKPENAAKNGWWVVVNEIMEQARKQGIAPERLTSELISVINDNALDEVARDYAIQQLAIWITPRGDTPFEANEKNVEAALTSIQGSITDVSLQHTSIPGTALNALADAHSGGVEAVDDVFTSLAPWIEKTITGTTHSTVVTRTSAINAIANVGRVEYLPLLREQIMSDSTDDSVKLSCVAALGTLHGRSPDALASVADDRETLEEIASSQTKFKYAAAAALKRIKK